MAQGENFSLIVSEPASVAGSYDMNSNHLFGLGSCASEVDGIVALGSSGTDTEACPGPGLDLDVEGQIALVDRGTCDFLEKAEAAQSFGAIAIIICNNVAEDSLLIFGLGDGDDVAARANAITIPAFSMRMRDCTTLKAEIANGIVATAQRESGGFFDPDSDDEVFYSEDFTGGLNGWTAEGLFCGEGADPGGALWTWKSGGRLSEGAFSNPSLEMISNDPCTGFFVFDSDFLDSDGINVGAGDCPVLHEGIITSPPIDLATLGAQEGDFIGIKFSQVGRQFDAIHVVEWSTDGGENWNEREVNRLNIDVERDDLFGGIQRFPLNGVNSSDNLLIRFRFALDYYVWGIDDVQIIKFVGINAQIENTFYTPLSTIVPITHADADTFVFITDVINSGVEEIDVRLDVEVVKVNTGLVVHEDNATLNGLESGDTMNIVVENFWVPNEIDTGLYSINYDVVVVNGDESNVDDNSETFFFAITEGLFGKALDIDRTAIRYRSTAEEQWGVAAQFPTANGVGRFAAEDISFGVFTPDGETLENFIAEVALLKMVGTSPGYFPADFDNTNNSYLNHPNFEVVYRTTHVFSDGAAVEFVNLDLSNEGIDLLEAGTRYFVMVFFDNNTTSRIGVANSELTMIADDAIPMSGVYAYLPDNSNTAWIPGFAGVNPAPLIAMGIALTSPVDEVPLPDEVFKAFPNPANDFVTAQLNFQEPTDVSLIIANIEGRILSVQNEKSLTNRNVQLDVSSIPNGSYLLRVSTSEGTKTTQIIVQH